MPMRGAKWMRNCARLSDSDIAKIMAEVEGAKRFCRDMQDLDSKFWYDPKHVGVRCPTYCGEPNPIAIVTYGPGGCSIYQSVYR